MEGRGSFRLKLLVTICVIPRGSSISRTFRGDTLIAYCFSRRCTKEMRDAKSELVVSETEKEAMRNQYQKSLDHRETERQQLEHQVI